MIITTLVSFWSHEIQSDNYKFIMLKCYMKRAEDYVMRDIRCINIGLIFEKAHRQLTLREVTCDWNSLYSTIIQLYNKDLLYLFSTLDFMRHLGLVLVKKCTWILFDNIEVWACYFEMNERNSISYIFDNLEFLWLE